MKNEDVNAVVACYQRHHPRARPGTKERKLIGDRLSEGYSVQDLCDAIDGNHSDDFYKGHNERGTKYHGLGLIFRSSEYVLKFIELWEAKQKTARREERRRLMRDEERVRFQESRQQIQAVLKKA